MSDIPSWAIRTEADRIAKEMGCTWDHKRAAAIVKFAESVFRPQYVAGEFRLLDWQKIFLQSIVAWRLPNGYRRFRYAHLHIPKKQGKTLIIAILGLWELLYPEEPSPVVIAGAASADNATQIFDEIKHTVNRSPFRPFAKILNNTKRVEFPDLNAKFMTYAFGDRGHGPNPTCVLIDEAHSHPSSLLTDTLVNATCARNSATVVVISTCGKSMNHFYYTDYYTKSKRVLKGEDKDILHFGMVFEMDQDGDPFKVEQWRKALPSLGVSTTEERFKLELESAFQSRGKWLTFQWQRLNKWVNASENSWLDVSDWSDHTTEITDKMLERAYCFVGCDLSSRLDPSSVSLMAKLDDKYYVKSWCWICKDGIEKRRDEVTNLKKYDEFIDAGWMVETPGDMIDPEPVKEKILELCREYNVLSVNFDPNSAYMMMNQIQDEGYECLRIPPTHRWINEPMKFTEQQYRAGKLLNDGNDWLKYCFQNCVIDVNKWEETTIDKAKKKDKIDGAYAVVLAMYSAMRHDNSQLFA